MNGGPTYWSPTLPTVLPELSRIFTHTNPMTAASPAPCSSSPVTVMDPLPTSHEFTEPVPRMVCTELALTDRPDAWPANRKRRPDGNAEATATASTTTMTNKPPHHPLVDFLGVVCSGSESDTAMGLGIGVATEEAEADGPGMSGPMSRWPVTLRRLFAPSTHVELDIGSGRAPLIPKRLFALFHQTEWAIAHLSGRNRSG